MKKMMTIGDYVAKNPGTKIRNNAYWHVVHNRNGAHAVVRMRVLLLAANGTVLAQAVLGEVWRGADVPHDNQWDPSAECTCAANSALCQLESQRTDDIPVVEFVGMNRAMPWELVPVRKTLWTRIINLFRGR